MPNDVESIKDFKNHVNAFTAAMDDDFQAQNGMTSVYDMIRDLNRVIEHEEVSKYVLEFMLDEISEILSIFGLENLKQEDLLDEEVDALIQEREEARTTKNFARADAIRDQLKAEGILLEDTAQGIRWKRAD